MLMLSPFSLPFVNILFGNCDNCLRKFPKPLEWCLDAAGSARFPFHHFLGRLPRPCRRRRNGFSLLLGFTDQLIVSQAFSDHAAHGQEEPAQIPIVVLALIESKHLFIEVSEQMKRFDAYVCSAHASLEERPEIFESVRVHLALCVALRVSIT